MSSCIGDSFAATYAEFVAAKAGVATAGRSTEQFRLAHERCITVLAASDVPESVKSLTRRVLDYAHQLTVLSAAKKSRKESRTSASSSVHTRHRLMKREHAQLKVALEKELTATGLMEPRQAR